MLSETSSGRPPACPTLSSPTITPHPAARERRRAPVCRRNDELL